MPDADAIVFKDKPDASTPLTAANLNGLQDRIFSRTQGTERGSLWGAFPGGVDNFGDSLSVGYGAHYFPYGSWPTKLARRVGAVQNAHAGAGVGAVGGFEDSWSLLLNRYDATLKADVTPPYRAWPAGERLVNIGFGFNDLNGNGVPAAGGQQVIPSFISAMRAMISRAMAGLVLEDAYFAVGGPGGAGDWSSVVTTARNSGGLYWETLVNSATFTYLTRHVLPGAVYTVGGPVLAGTTGFIDITVDGVAYATVDLSAAAPKTTGKYGEWCCRISGMTPYSADGSGHVIVGTTRALGSGKKATIDYCHCEADRPPLVLVKNVARPLNNTPYWAASQAARDTDIAAMNAALLALCAEFIRPGKTVSPAVYLDFDAKINRDPAYFSATVTDTGTTLNDDLHWNDSGHLAVADVAYAGLQRAWLALTGA